MGRRRMKKGNRPNRYMERHKAINGKSPNSQTTPPGKSDDDVVTHGELKALLDPIANQMSEVHETIVGFHESMKGAPKTGAEAEEKANRQLADAEKINRRKAKAQIFAAPTLGGDALFKGVHSGMSRKEAKDKIQEVVSSPTDDALVEEFQYRYDRIKLQCHLLGKQPFQLQCWEEHEKWLEKTGIGKVLNLTSAPANYIPEGWSMQTLQYYYQALRVASAFEEYPMTHGVETFPIIGRPEAQYQTARGPSRATTDEFTATDPDEGITIFRARTLHVRVDLEEEYVEDAANVLDKLLVLIPNAMAKGMESAIINGSRTATHEDNRFHNKTNAVEKAFDGLRRIVLERGTEAILNIEANSGTFGFDDFSRLLEKGSQEYHVTPEDCCWVFPNAVYTKCMRFTQLETWDKNPLPTNINGVVGMILGRPVVLSGEYPQDLGEAGVITAQAANNVHTGFTHFNKMQFMIGNRRSERVRQGFDDRNGHYYIVATTRRDFQTMENRRAGYTPALSAINITTAS